ncbi:MAG: hypothetical protein ACLR78_03350 [Roseburia sp.]
MKITAGLDPSMNMCGTSRPGQMSFSADTYLMNGIKIWTVLPLNRREVLGINVQIGAESELRGFWRRW